MLNRKEIIELLEKENVMEEIDRSVAENEMTLEAKERLIAYLSEHDKEKAKEQFAEILKKDIEAAPTYENKKEELQGWKELRSYMSQKVHNIDQEVRLQEDKIAKMREEQIKSLPDLKNPISAKKIKEYSAKFTDGMEQIANEHASIEQKTKALAAATIMLSEAKSEAAQTRNQYYMNTYIMPKVELLASKVQGLSEYIQERADSVRQFFQGYKKSLDMLDRSSDLASEMKKLARSDEAAIAKEKFKVEFKAYNKQQKEIQKAKERLVKKVVKIQAKDLKNKKNLASLNKWLEGKPIAIDAVEIENYKQAKEYLEMNGNASLEKEMKAISEMQKEAGQMNQNLHTMANTMRDGVNQRQAILNSFTQDLSQQVDEMKMSRPVTNMMRDNLEETEKNVYINDFDKDEKAWLDNQGYDDIFER